MEKDGFDPQIVAVYQYDAFNNELYGKITRMVESLNLVSLDGECSIMVLILRNFAFK